MKATFENKNHVFLVGYGSFLLHVNAAAGKFWKNHGKIREFDSGNLVGTLVMKLYLVTFDLRP